MNEVITIGTDASSDPPNVSLMDRYPVLRRGTTLEKSPPNGAVAASYIGPAQIRLRRQPIDNFITRRPALAPQHSFKSVTVGEYRRGISQNYIPFRDYEYAKPVISNVRGATGKDRLGLTSSHILWLDG